MGIPKTDDPTDAQDPAGEIELRGDTLQGADEKRAVGRTANIKKQNPDSVVRADDEEDTLYDDGLELEDDTPPMGTDGRANDNAR